MFPLSSLLPSFGLRSSSSSANTTLSANGTPLTSTLGLPHSPPPPSSFFGASSGSQRKTIELEPVEQHGVEEGPAKEERKGKGGEQEGGGEDGRARTALKYLIKANHVNWAVIYHELRFHNHASHILGSAYILGADCQHLNRLYEEEAKSLEPWTDSPGEISADDWRDFLGKREYQRAYVDFFEDQLVRYRYDWRKMLEEYFLAGENPLINNVICGLGHPLIHLGYSQELSSRTLGIEALTLSSCFYDDLHKYLDDPSYTFPPPPSLAVTPKAGSTKRGNALLVLLHRLHADTRFDNLFTTPGPQNIATLLSLREREILEYWNAWDILQSDDPRAEFEASQRTAVALLLGTVPLSSTAPSSKTSSSPSRTYDFFIVHLLTTSHAARILIPHLPRPTTPTAPDFRIGLARQWWLFVLLVYASQLRPAIDVERNICDYELRGRGWGFVVQRAKEGFDAHFVKACRAMKEASETWGDDGEGDEDEEGGNGDRGKHYFLKAAVRFANEFEGWGGSSSSTTEEQAEGVKSGSGEYFY